VIYQNGRYDRYREEDKVDEEFYGNVVFDEVNER
jgi:hypothetical protein